jgi:predicted XRE-type DNA-binding protein
MKVKKVVANNRKKAFEITTAQAVYDFPFSRLTLKPTEKNPVAEAFSDAEIGHEGFTYRLTSGMEDTIVMDQVLEYAKDPEYLRRDLLFRLTLKAQACMEELQISKREIVRRMGTTPAQFYRLMDQKNTNKTIDQMVKLLAAMDCSVDVVFGEAA